MNNFLAGSVGAEPGDDPRIMALLDKTDLAMTLSMKAHFGASGGRSPQMLQHFLNMANARKMNANTLSAGINALDDYMGDRGMAPSAGNPGTQLKSQGGGQAAPGGGAQQAQGDHHIIAIGNKQYQFKGTGNTADLKNYTELPQSKR
jgi:hypothetical protein